MTHLLNESSEHILDQCLELLQLLGCIVLVFPKSKSLQQWKEVRFVNLELEGGVYHCE